MDTRQLQYFISVAEHLNFTKAAEHHFLSQTAISQQIMSLEQHLGVKLFLRHTRSVQLTPAGKVFYKEAKIIVAKTEDAINKTLKADSGFEGLLKIGFLDPNVREFLPRLIRHFKQNYPAIDLMLYQENMGKLHEAISHGLLDIAFTTTYGLDQITGLSRKTLYKDPWCAILHQNHPLANETKISRSALANDFFIALEREVAPVPYDCMIQKCVEHGFTPKIVATCRSLESILMLIEAEIGIAIFRRSIESYAHKNLHFVDLEGDDEFSEIVVVWMDNNPNPAVPLFLNMLKDVSIGS